jgi:hypothetical protein
MRWIISAFVIVGCSVFVGAGETRAALAVDPVGAVGALFASQARSPHSNPGGGKLTIGEVVLSRLVSSRAGVASKTPHVPGFSARGCEAAMASAHDGEIPTGAGVFAKTAVFPVHLGYSPTSLLFGEFRYCSKFGQLVVLQERKANGNAERGKPRAAKRRPGKI